MLKNLPRAVRTLWLCVFSALLLTVCAYAANTSYLIRSSTDTTRSIFAISKALDQGAKGILPVQEDNQVYGLPVYRAGADCTVTIQGSAAQLRVFPVDLLGGGASVRWTGELAPSIGQMRVTLSDGVQTIAASEFKNYSSRLTGAYTHEVGAGFRLTDAGYYLISHSESGLAPSSIIVQVEGSTTAASQGSAAQSGTSVNQTVSDPTLAGLFGPVTDTSGTAQGAQTQAVTAVQNSAPVLINGRRVMFDAYIIQEGTYGYTYFKLRDLAAALSGTSKQYEVMWDKATESILLRSGQPYTLTGGELAAGAPGTQAAKVSHSLLYKDNVPVSLTAYVIGQNNYFKLRDIAQLFNFSADWDNDAMCIVIDTSKEYTP